MFKFNKIISNLLVEAPPNPTPAPNPTTAPEDPDAKKLYNDLIKRADQDIKNPGTTLANSGKNLVETYFIAKGLQWKNREYYGQGVQRKNLDSLTAKYVDCAAQVYKKADNLKEPLQENFENIKDNSEALQIIKQFNSVNIMQYQCVDPILKSITEVDDLAEIALATFNNETIFGAVIKMLQQRAGKLKVALNKKTLQAMLAYPAQYASGQSGIPDPLDKSLVESSMYNERLLAIGVAAIEYFKYLVNIEVARITAERRKKRGKKATEQFNLNTLVYDILNEADKFSVPGAQGNPQNARGQFTGINLRGPGGLTQSIEQRYGETDMLKLVPFNLFDRKTWKQDNAFEKQYMSDYISFITNGTAQSVPTTDEKGKPIVYNIATIALDRSTQAQQLIKALEGIAQYKRIKKSLMSQIGNAAGNLAKFAGVGDIYGGVR